MNTTLLIVGIIVLIIGIVMIIIGISIHENNIANGTTTQPWYVWFLIIGGIVISIVGGLVMAFSATGGKKKACPPPPCGPPPCGQPMMQTQQYMTAPSPQTQTYTINSPGLPAVYPQSYMTTEFVS